MPSEIINRWFLSEKYACLNGIDFKPRAHPKFPKSPLSAIRGQAEAFYLIGLNGERHILKKFHSNCEPEEGYLQKIQGLVPLKPGMESATQRVILTPDSLFSHKGTYYCEELQKWVWKTILMPQVPGYAWADFADNIRDGSIKPTYEERIRLCYNLTQHILALEEANCCHRDISSDNVFIDPSTFNVNLIDWDSFFSTDLQMPLNTTCGTEGYIAPFIPKRNGYWDPHASWCEKSDRFALSLVNVELLCIGPSFAATHDGGIFDQAELARRKGKILKKIRKELASNFPRALELLDQAIASKSFKECPAPQDWLAFCRESMPGSLDEINGVDTKKMIKILTKQRKKERLQKDPSVPPPAPSLPKPPDFEQHLKKVIQKPHNG